MTDTDTRPEVPVGSLRAAWRALLAAPDRILVPTLVLSATGAVVHVGLQYLVGLTVAGSRTCSREYLDTVLAASCGPSNQRAQVALAVGLFALFVVGQLVVAGIYRAGIDLFDDRPVQGPFAGIRWELVVPAALVTAALLTVSTALLLVPVLVGGFFTRYALLFVLDQSKRPFEALVESVKLVAADWKGELGFVLRSALVLLAGFLCLGVGLFVAVPVVLMAQVARFRVATADSWWF